MSKKAFAQGLKKPALDKFASIHRPDPRALAETNPGVKPHEARGVRILRPDDPRAKTQKMLARALNEALKTARHTKTGV